MPKITLKNGETGGLESFEPIDAREILAMPGTIYSVPDETRDAIGGPTVATEVKEGESVPQLQGQDAEMQTGLSVEKYGREAVVKAEVGDPEGRGQASNTDPRVAQGPKGLWYVMDGKERTSKGFKTRSEAEEAARAPGEPTPAA